MKKKALWLSRQEGNPPRRNKQHHQNFPFPPLEREKIYSDHKKRRVHIVILCGCSPKLINVYFTNYFPVFRVYVYPSSFNPLFTIVDARAERDMRYMYCDIVLTQHKFHAHEG